MNVTLRVSSDEDIPMAALTNIMLHCRNSLDWLKHMHRSRVQITEEIIVMTMPYFDALYLEAQAYYDEKEADLLQIKVKRK